MMASAPPALPSHVEETKEVREAIFRIFLCVSTYISFIIGTNDETVMYLVLGHCPVSQEGGRSCEPYSVNRGRDSTQSDHA